MNKIEKDRQKAFERVTQLCDFINSYTKNLQFELLDKDQKNIPIHKKSRNNTIIGRRGNSPFADSRMGITIKATNKNTNQYVLLEPRINTSAKDHFKSTYLKGVSGDESDIIFLDSTAILIVDDSHPKYYAIYEYSQVSEQNIKKGYKGSGNARRINLNSINATPIPINGSSGPLGEPGLEKAIINLIEKIGK